MKVTDISVKAMGVLLNETDMLTIVGEIAGECYGSPTDIPACINRAIARIKQGHHSPFEHVNITLKCTVDRGVSHALVRHRHCAFQQSSTIFQRYKELTFVDKDENNWPLYTETEVQYRAMLDSGMPPSKARDILPNSLATNLIITTNVRQWMYMIQRRCGPGDSDNMHEWCRQVRDWFEHIYPVTTKAFDEWYAKHPL